MNKLTYNQIIILLDQSISTGARKAGTVNNMKSALRHVLAVSQRGIDDPIGDELRDGFRDTSAAIKHILVQRGLTHRTITSTLSAVKACHHFLLESEMGRIDSETPFQRTLRECFGDHPLTGIAKECGTTTKKLGGWLDGKQPDHSDTHLLRRLARFFGLNAEALLDLLPKRLQTRIDTPEEPQEHKIAYRERCRKNKGFHYRLQPASDSPIRDQWLSLVKYKVAAIPPNNLKRRVGANWSMNRTAGISITPTRWYCHLGDRYVPSASLLWGFVSSYLGWLILPESEGGGGLPAPAVNTLAWLAVPGKLSDYLEWLRSRGPGTYTPHMVGDIKSLRALLTRDVGYLRQCPTLHETLPRHLMPESVRDLDWDALCDQQVADCAHLIGHTTGKVDKSRDPFEALGPLVDLDHPMVAIAEMFTRMKADLPPNATDKQRAILSRDLTALKFLVACPLRAANIEELTYFPEGGGELYRKKDGSWHVHIAARRFKNSRHLQKPYRLALPPMIWETLDTYTSIYRPMLLGGTTSDLAFVCPAKESAKPDPSMWLDFSKRVSKLTKRYMLGTHGIHAHAFRNLVGYIILKKSNGNVEHAAALLHDSPLVVQKHYAKYLAKDISQMYHDWMGKDFDLMK